MTTSLEHARGQFAETIMDAEGERNLRAWANVVVDCANAVETCSR